MLGVWDQALLLKVLLKRIAVWKNKSVVSMLCMFFFFRRAANIILLIVLSLLRRLRRLGSFLWLYLVSVGRGMGWGGGGADRAGYRMLGVGALASRGHQVWC